MNYQASPAYAFKAEMLTLPEISTLLFLWIYENYYVFLKIFNFNSNKKKIKKLKLWFNYGNHFWPRIHKIIFKQFLKAVKEFCFVWDNTSPCHVKLGKVIKFGDRSYFMKNIPTGFFKPYQSILHWLALDYYVI